MTRCQSELDPVVVARCDARRRREDETGRLAGGRRATLPARERPPVSRSAVLGIWGGHRTRAVLRSSCHGRGRGRGCRWRCYDAAVEGCPCFVLNLACPVPLGFDRVRCFDSHLRYSYKKVRARAPSCRTAAPAGARSAYVTILNYMEDTSQSRLAGSAIPSAPH